MATPTPHDALFRRILSDPRLAAEVIQSALPPEVAACIDFGTLELLSGSFVDDDLRATQSDLVFSAMIAGREARLFVLVEHQSSPDALMPFRLLRYAVRVNGFDTVALTKLDVLDQCDTVKICTGYRYRGDILTDFPQEEAVLAEVEPVYEEVSGWMTPTGHAKQESDLPAKARRYLEQLQELIGVPFCMVSTGPQRDDTILCEDSLPKE